MALTAALEPFGASHEDTGATTRYGVALHLAHAIVKAHGGSMRIDPGPLVVVEMPSDAA